MRIHKELETGTPFFGESVEDYTMIIEETRAYVIMYAIGVFCNSCPVYESGDQEVI